jgi:hypothetical protein
LFLRLQDVGCSRIAGSLFGGRFKTGGIELVLNRDIYILTASDMPLAGDALDVAGASTRLHGSWAIKRCDGVALFGAGMWSGTKQKIS